MQFLAITVLVGLGAVTALPVPVLAQGAGTQAGAVRDFDIPAQPLASALNVFGRQSGLQLTLASAATQGVVSRPVSGRMTPQQALATMLAGTGVQYRVSDDATVVVMQNGAEDDPVAADGSLVLDPIDITAGGGTAADTPYRTPGSVAYISEEQINRIQPISPGDIFREVPGVLSGSNHNGPAIDVNIRGMQGHNRVKVMVEGTQQDSSTYRGYAGPDNSTYVDPELIGGIEIEKGPGSDIYGAGTAAGVVNVRMLGADDIVPDGERLGLRLRGGLGGSAITPRFPPFDFTWRGNNDVGLLKDHNRFLSDDDMFGSIAGAFKNERFEAVLAYAARDQGNYFAGTDGPTTYFWDEDDFSTRPIVPGRTRRRGAFYAPKYSPGGEVPNTSKQFESLLARAKLKLEDGQSLEVGHYRLDGKYGQMFPSYLNFYSLQEYGLLEIDSRRYWARYRWDSDSDLINLRANVWNTTSEDEASGGWREEFPGDTIETDAWGFEVANTSEFDTALGGLSLSYGGSYASSDLTITDPPYMGGRVEADGTREIAGAFVNGDLQPTQWLTINAGLRYDHYHGEGFTLKDAFHPVPREDGDLRDSAVSPRFGVTLEPVDGVQFFALYRRGFRAPSIVEASGAGTSALFTLNPDLKAERLTSWEVGVNIARDGLANENDALRAKFVYFDNDYTDYIARTPIPGGSSSITDVHFSNIPGAKINGIEMSASYDVGFLFAQASLNYFTRFEYCYDLKQFVAVDDGTGTYRPDLQTFPGCHEIAVQGDWQSNQVPPKYTSSITLGTRLFDEKLVLGGRMNFHSESLFDPPRQRGVSGAVRWAAAQTYDLFGSYTFNEHLTMNFSVENLTDQFYVSPLLVTPMPSPGRTARLSLTGRF